MGRLLGIDYGERRVGVARSDEDESMAFPLETITVRGVRHALEALVKRCREQDCTGFILGLPLNMNGTRGEMAAKVEAFAEKLRGACDVPVTLWDERLSTAVVESVMRGADVGSARRGALRDKLAAQQILQSYLDARETGPLSDDGGCL